MSLVYPFQDRYANRLGPIIQEYHRYKCFVCSGHKDISFIKEEDHTITTWSSYGYPNMIHNIVELNLRIKMR